MIPEFRTMNFQTQNGLPLKAVSSLWLEVPKQKFCALEVWLCWAFLTLLGNFQVLGNPVRMCQMSIREYGGVIYLFICSAQFASKVTTWPGNLIVTISYEYIHTAISPSVLVSYCCCDKLPPI